jgi:GDP-L-fucose synthase
MNVFVTGGRGFLGRHVVESLRSRGIPVREIGRQEGDLRDPAAATHLLAGADTIVHRAADVGGVGYLKSCPGRAFHDNFRLGLNVVKAACEHRVRRLVLAGSPCSYSGDVPLPLREESLGDGVPSGDTGTYGYAKMATSLAAKDWCGMHGIDTVTVIPSNLYGPGDRFEQDRGHVVAALLRKALLARASGRPTFDVWGDGSATRDFVYVTDVAEAIASIAVSETGFDGEIFNLGSGRETAIGEIAEVIARECGPKLRPKFLADSPVGYTRRVMSIEKAAAAIGYQAATGLEAGIRTTVRWLSHNGFVDAWMAEQTAGATPRMPRPSRVALPASGRTVSRSRAA